MLQDGAPTPFWNPREPAPPSTLPDIPSPIANEPRYWASTVAVTGSIAAGVPSQWNPDCLGYKETNSSRSWKTDRRQAN